MILPARAAPAQAVLILVKYQVLCRQTACMSLPAAPVEAIMVLFIYHSRQMPLHTLLFIPAQVPVLPVAPLFIRLPALVIQNHARSVHQEYPATPYIPQQAVAQTVLSINHHPPDTQHVIST
jgi:hypothetical protein